MGSLLSITQDLFCEMSSNLGFLCLKLVKIDFCENIHKLQFIFVSYFQKFIYFYKIKFRKKYCSVRIMELCNTKNFTHQVRKNLKMKLMEIKKTYCQVILYNCIKV